MKTPHFYYVLWLHEDHHKILNRVHMVFCTKVAALQYAKDLKNYPNVSAIEVAQSIDGNDELQDQDLLAKLDQQAHILLSKLVLSCTPLCATINNETKSYGASIPDKNILEEARAFLNGTSPLKVTTIKESSWKIPLCPICHSSEAMIFHQLGQQWICCQTHPVDERPTITK
jgi:hypothetical protein